MSTIRKPHKKMSFFDIAFCALLVLFFIVSIFTCGNFQSTGKSALIKSDENHVAVFEVKGASRANVKWVYLNIGYVSAEDGEELAVKIKTSTGKTSKPGVSFGADTTQRQEGVKYVVGTDENYVAYNWLKVYSDNENGKEFATVSITANKSFLLNEFVCVDKDGKVVELQVNKNLSAEYVHPVATLAGAIDAPHSFTGSEKANAVFTQEESRMMTAIDNMRLGRSYEDGFIYHAETGAGAIATALYLPSVAIFGHSVGALRLTSVLFSTAALALSYLFIKLLFKDGKSGFCTALLFVLSSLPLTLGKVGTPHALLLFALIGSAYCMFRFFALGVANEKVKTSGLPVLFSGLLSALAVAVNLSAIFPVLGILTLFAFGLKRQQKAHELALSQIPEDDEQAIRKENAVYCYKNKTVGGYALLSFALGTFIFLLLGGVLGYNSLVRAYDNPAEPSLGFMTIMIKSTSGFGLSNPLALLLPLSRVHLWQSGKIYFTAIFNPVLLITAIVCFLFCATLSVLSLVQKTTDKESARLKRITLILFGGMVLCLLQAIFTGFTLSSVLPCALALIAFIPLAYKTSQRLCKKGTFIANIALCAVVVLSAVFFLITLSQTFGFDWALGTLFK